MTAMHPRYPPVASTLGLGDAMATPHGVPRQGHTGSQVEWGGVCQIQKRFLVFEMVRVREAGSGLGVSSDAWRLQEPEAIHEEASRRSCDSAVATKGGAESSVAEFSSTSLFLILTSHPQPDFLSPS